MKNIIITLLLSFAVIYTCKAQYISFEAQCDTFYIEQEHGAYTLTSIKSEYNIIDREDLATCIRALITIKSSTCDTDTLFWDHYDSIINPGQSNLNDFQYYLPNLQLLPSCDKIVTDLANIQFIYIVEDIVHYYQSDGEWYLELESIGMFAKSIQLDDILIVISQG